MIIERTIGPESAGRVLRDYLISEFEFSLRLLRRLKANFLITVNGNIGYTNIVLREGDALRIDVDGLARSTADRTDAPPLEKYHITDAMGAPDHIIDNHADTPPPDAIGAYDCANRQPLFTGGDFGSIVPEYIPLDVLYEDEYLIIINKQPGLIIHPSSIDGSGTIANGLAYYYAQTRCKSRIHPISRLDRQTSGVILFAKDPYTTERLRKIMQDGKFNKEYLGVVYGEISPPAGFIDLPLGRVDGYIMLRRVRCDGKRALTYYETLQSNESASLLLLSPATGRTHQLRAHLTALGHPLLADGLYGTGMPGDPHSKAIHTPSSPVQPIARQALAAPGCLAPIPTAGSPILPNSKQSIPAPGCLAPIPFSSSPTQPIARHALAAPNYLAPIPFVDSFDSPAQPIARQALHSWRLTFPHPHTSQTIAVTGPPPSDIINLLSAHNFIYD